jgi:hypothetical protein
MKWTLTYISNLAHFSPFKSKLDALMYAMKPVNIELAEIALYRPKTSLKCPKQELNQLKQVKTHR